MYNFKSPKPGAFDRYPFLGKGPQEGFKQPLEASEGYKAGYPLGYARGWADACFRMRQEVDVLKNSQENT